MQFLSHRATGGRTVRAACGGCQGPIIEPLIDHGVVVRSGSASGRCGEDEFGAGEEGFEGATEEGRGGSVVGWDGRAAQGRIQQHSRRGRGGG